MTIERNRSRTVSSLEKTIFKEKEGQQSNDREGISFVRENNGATADVVLVDLETPLLIVALLEFQVGSTKNERSNVGRDIRKEESTATRSSVTDQETKCFFASLGWNLDGSRRGSRQSANDVPAPLTPQRRARLHCSSRHTSRNNNNNNSSSNNNNRSSNVSVSVSGLDRRHNCSRCGKSYKNAYILKRHLLYECGKAPSFNCPHCAFSSKYERNLKAHINHRHVAPQSSQGSSVSGSGASGTGSIASTAATVNQRA
ncbi:uncharacterized protein LOC105663826 [Megachile rotundata]|uniref:uncharacterized protein LOC105663826 n=1 Tax=Megachile rotundata TaxID=143995 RepID=UPI003FD51A8E